MLLRDVETVLSPPHQARILFIHSGIHLSFVTVVFVLDAMARAQALFAPSAESASPSLSASSSSSAAALPYSPLYQPIITSTIGGDVDHSGGSVNARPSHLERRLFASSAAAAAEISASAPADIADADDGIADRRFALTQHKFEMNQLVGLFLGARWQRAYEVTVMLYLVGALWSYTSVFGASIYGY